MQHAEITDEQDSPVAEVSLDEAISYAMSLHRNQQLEGAETIYRRILDCMPNHPDVLHHFGLVRYQRGYAQEAIDLIRVAVDQVPDFADYHANLANLYLSEGRFDEAMSSCRRAIELDPLRADFHNNLGVLWRAQGQPEEAEAAYQRAIALDPGHFRAYNNLGMLTAARGEVEEAVRLYCTAITLTPGHPEGHKLLGLAYYQLGRLDEASAVFRHWLEQEPGNPTAMHHLAACSGQDVPDRAADEYVARTFDNFAASFEDQLQNKLSYRAPQQVVSALQRHLPLPVGQFDVLDLGCGTGLCGPLIKPWVASLTGIDLSIGMLRKAEAKGCYDCLWRVELGEFLRKPEQAGMWDLLLSADTLCYFGSLEQVAGAAFAALKADGLFAFSVEDAGDGFPATGHRLNPNGRYSHASSYLRACFMKAGFRLLELEGVVLRTEGGKPVNGIVAVVKK